MIFWRRLIQALAFGLFIWLLAGAIYGLWIPLADHFFLSLDPSLTAATLLAARALPPALITGLIVIGLAPVVGRAFCGYICPLGATLDVTDRLISPGRSKPRPGLAKLRPGGRWLLALTIGSALIGVSLVFVASPLSLATRFYGLLVHGLAARLADLGLEAVRPLGQTLDWTGLTMAQFRPPRYATLTFIALLFGLILAAARLAPRFWCRYLCPSGALLGLLSFRPLFRRRVSSACTECGRCLRACPMGAIEPDFKTTRHQDCLLCLRCQAVCPEGAVGFTPAREETAGATAFSLERRGFLYSGLAGAGMALVGRAGLASPFAPSGTGPAAPIRPPAALPEPEFLSRCVRCGLCSAVCPTNTLQPIWLGSGFTALFSPAVTPRQGACDPHCHRCAEVCPVEAIRPIGTEERVWAKIGTAVIDRHRCLAWEQDKKCMVCDEVCPYGAIEFSRQPGLKVAAPEVIESKCAGCGYCQRHCPVEGRAAIEVWPTEALRPASGSLSDLARRRGLSLTLRPPGGYAAPREKGKKDGLPPGITLD